VPITCAGTLVMPGDIVVGDAEGVVILPAQFAEEIAHDAVEQEEREAWALERVNDGESIRGVYPILRRAQARVRPLARDAEWDAVMTGSGARDHPRVVTRSDDGPTGTVFRRVVVQAVAGSSPVAHPEGPAVSIVRLAGALRRGQRGDNSSPYEGFAAARLHGVEPIRSCVAGASGMRTRGY